MPSKIDDLVFQVEAVLFASGKPLAVKEISEALKLEDFRLVQRAVRTLEQTYGNRQSALEVRRVGDRYALQLQEKYVTTVHAVTPVEMAPRTLRALTLIAYHQPILQSHIVRMIGDVAYEEVQRLRGIGLVHTEPKGSTLELTTTRRFAEYFGIASTRPDEIRRFLEQKLGVAPSVAAPEVASAGEVTATSSVVPTEGAPPDIDPSDDAPPPNVVPPDDDPPTEPPIAS